MRTPENLKTGDTIIRDSFAFEIDHIDRLDRYTFEIHVKDHPASRLASFVAVFDDEFEVVVDCPECGGGGDVSWNPNRSGDPQCVESADCPLCASAGVVPV